MTFRGFRSCRGVTTVRRALIPLLILAVAGGWYLTAGHAAGQVSVSWQGAPRCDGAEYKPVRTLGPRPAIHARRGSRCTITVVITNDSAHTARLDQLVAPYMGRDGGGVLQAVPQPPETEAERRFDDDTDASYRLDHDLGPGETHEVEITLGFRERGCSHARTSLAGFPSLELTVLGRGRLTVPAADDLLFIQAGPSSECEAP